MLSSPIPSVPSRPVPGSGRDVRAWVRSTALTAAVCLLLPGCSKAKPTGEAGASPVVAEVGTRTISAQDLLAEADYRVKNGRPLPAKEQLLREMIEREALLQRARQAGLEQDPAFRREVESLLLRKFQATELEPRRESVAISDEAVKAEYEANRERHTRPAQARLALLFLAADAKASDDRKAELRARLEEGRRKFVALHPTPPAALPNGFGPLAVEYSDDQVSRYRGGDLGWLVPGKHPARVPAAVAEAGWALPAGQVSEVMEAQGGFYVVVKTDSRPPSVTPLESVSTSLRQTLLVRERKAVEDAFQAETARRFPSKVHTQALATVTLPAPSAALAARNREPQPPALPGTNESSHGN